MVSGRAAGLARATERLDELDLADLTGMADARYAARGRRGRRPPPDARRARRGPGKTTLAERIPGILPDLTVEESLELTAIHSLAGGLPAR